MLRSNAPSTIRARQSSRRDRDRRSRSPSPRPGRIDRDAITDDGTFGSTIRRFCFTYMLEPEELFIFRGAENAYVRRYVYQFEVTPTTGRDHVQGYCELLQPRRKDWIKLHLLSHGAHIEKSRGSAKDNYVYCTKDASRMVDTEPVFGGDWSDMTGQGRRSDLTALHAKLNDLTVPLADVLKDDTVGPTALRYLSNVTAFRPLVSLHVPRHLTPEQVSFEWHCGPSGAGKTRAVYERFAAADVYAKAARTKWWDGYTGQSVCLIDDYRPNKDFAYDDLLRVCDYYPLPIEAKGTSFHLVSNTNTIIITSNKWPWELWPADEQDPTGVLANLEYTPLVRRCKLVCWKTLHPIQIFPLEVPDEDEQVIDATPPVNHRAGLYPVSNQGDDEPSSPIVLSQ